MPKGRLSNACTQRSRTAIAGCLPLCRALPRCGACPLPCAISSFAGQREFVSVVGPSSGGKSTLLNLVAGLDRPSEGTVSLRGAEVSDPNSIGLLTVIGVMMYRAVTGIENRILALPAARRLADQGPHHERRYRHDCRDGASDAGHCRRHRLSAAAGKRQHFAFGADARHLQQCAQLRVACWRCCLIMSDDHRLECPRLCGLDAAGGGPAHTGLLCRFAGEPAGCSRFQEHHPRRPLAGLPVCRKLRGAQYLSRVASASA